MLPPRPRTQQALLEHSHRPEPCTAPRSWLSCRCPSGRLRIASSSHQAKAAKAGVPLPGDDDVVMDSNAEQLANLDDLLAHIDVGPRWRGVARGVVVDENAAGGMQFD